MTGILFHSLKFKIIMKHIKEFNENNEDIFLDIDYIKACFIDLIDSKEYSGEIETYPIELSDRDDLVNSCSFYCLEPEMAKTINSDVEYYESIGKVDEFISELKTGISRLKDEYPNYKIKFNVELNSNPDDDFNQRVIILDISL